MIKQQLFIGAALLAGVAIGYFSAPQGTAPAATDGEETSVTKAAIADVGESAALTALRARVKELEAKLADRTSSDAELVSNVVANVQEGRPDGRRRGNPQDWLEEIKKNDPARYQQMTNQFARWRQRRVERQQSKLDYLGSIDTTGMSKEARAAHERLQDLIVRHDEIESELSQEGLTWEQRGEIFGRLHESGREIAELNRQERRTLIGEVGKTLGLGKEDAAALAEEIGQIIEVTDNGFGHGPGGGRGPGRGGRGGPQQGR